MSSFLTVNGVTLPVAQGSVRETIRDIGTTETAFDGSMLRQRLATKYDLELETTPAVGATAFAWQQLLRGEGNHWSFNSTFYSSKGIGPSSTTGCSLVSSPTPAYGAKCLDITGGNSFVVAGYTSGGTVTTLLWRYESGAWHHYIIDGNAVSVYRDGSSYGGSIAAWFSATGGNITLTGAGDFDDMTVLPFYMPTDWYSGVYTFMSSYAWSDCPRLTLAGDAIWEATTRSVMGFCETSKPLSGVVGGSFTSTARTLSILLKGT